MAGLTLIELMVVISVVAILLAIATPSFMKTIQRNRVATEVNSLVADLQLARGQAIKEGMPVTVCISNDGASCSTTLKTWQTGWISFSDSNANHVVDSGETILRRQVAFSGTDTFGNGSTSWITYSRDGFLSPLGASGDVTLTLDTSPTNADAKRCLVLSIVGRQKVASC